MIELLRKRRSIRRYQSRGIEGNVLEILKEALLRCPSSRSINPWDFIFVDDPELLKKLSLSKKHGSSFLKDAPLGIVVCGNESESDVWIEDCSIASITVQYVAESLNLGNCWIQIRNRFFDEKKTSEQYIKEILQIPEQIRVESIIGIGYPAEKKDGHPESTLQYNKILLNRYQK